MRILFINPYYKPYLGGIERVIEKLGQEFLHRHEVEAVGVLTTQWAFPRKYTRDWPTEEKIEGLSVFRLSSWPNLAPPFFQVPLVWFNPLEIRKIIQKFQPDVIQFMTDKWFWGNFWGWYFKPKNSVVGFSLSFHKLTLAKQWLRPINAFLSRKADCVQVITHLEKQLVKKAYWLENNKSDSNKFQVIPWGINFPKDRSWETAQQKAIREIVILCVGRLSKHKGQIWLLQIFAEVQNSITKNVKLIFVGGDEGVEKDLRFKINDLGIGKKVEILGEVDDYRLQNLYRQADIFALFPEYEAFGLVFLEAMAQAVPVLTHKVGAIEEVLKDKAMLIEPYNKAQAKVALVKLIEDKKFRLQFGQEGKKYVWDNFSWEKTAKEFLKGYKSF